MRVFQLSRGTDACEGCKLSEIFSSVLLVCKQTMKYDASGDAETIQQS